MPVSLHILSGFDYSRRIYEPGPSLVSEGLAMYKLSITQKLGAVMDSLFEIVLSGVLDRHPDLRLVLVENEVAWIPFVVDQLQYYYERFLGQSPVVLERAPAQAFRDQVSATFFRDPNARLAIESVGAGNFMWSNDYPHGNSTWPHYAAGRRRDARRTGRRGLRGSDICERQRLYGLDLEQEER